MPEPNEFVTVFRSADPSAETQAAAVCNLLEQAGLSPRVFTDEEPGVPAGAVEVRVAPQEAAEAEALIAAQAEGIATVDPSPELDLVTVFRSNRHDAESEAVTVKGLLESNGIEAVLVGASVIPSLEFEVRVARENEEKALQLIREAELSGPQAADAAEAGWEGCESGAG